jgi:hypothetical protein
MTKYIGVCNKIDWNDIIKQLASATPTYVGPSHKEGDLIPGLKNVTDLWNRAGFKTVHQGGNVGWDMFISGHSFDEKIAEKFCEFVGLDSYTSCWISRINIGHFSPWHWDVNDDEAELAKRQDIRRFHCHISPPEHGHVLIVEDKCFYNQPQGSVYEWPSRQSWHAGMNSGLVPKYLFNLW